MYHYIGLIWNINNTQASAVAALFAQTLQQKMPKWKCEMLTAGMTVFTITPKGRALRSYTLPGKSGIILGRLFPTDLTSVRSSWEPVFSERGCHEFVSSGGQKLMEDYWGGYVAFLHSSAREVSLVIRDCSGSVPCYRTRHHGVEIIFSDLNDLSAFPLPPFTVDFHYIAAFIYEPDLQVNTCGLTEVAEILAGECVTIGKGPLISAPLWDPGRVCSTRNFDDQDQARMMLAITAQGCIDAWLSVYDNILLSLSGGFDSAVVLGSMRKSAFAPRVKCYTAYGEHVHEDERRFARLAAEGAQVELHEYPLDPGVVIFDDNLFMLPKTAKPSVGVLGVIINFITINPLVKSLDSEVVFTGEGGDHLFLYTKWNLGAADYIWRRGLLHRGLFGVLQDTSHLARTPYFSTLLTALKQAHTSKQWRPAPRLNNHFVRREVLPHDILEAASNPWLRTIQNLPAGKQAQAYYLADAVNRNRPLPGYQHAYYCHPLLSQPLIELCLQIPTYHLATGGRQRGLARDAFSDRVPKEIRMRDDKGSATSTVLGYIVRSETFIRDILQDGVLTRQGIVDRQKLEPYIAGRKPLHPDLFRSLLACVTAEVWVRSLKSGAARIAA